MVTSMTSFSDRDSIQASLDPCLIQHVAACSNCSGFPLRCCRKLACVLEIQLRHATQCNSPSFTKLEVSSRYSLNIKRCSRPWQSFGFFNRRCICVQICNIQFKLVLFCCCSRILQDECDWDLFSRVGKTRGSNKYSSSRSH